MAKKKNSTGKGINLLKGITGSKLAKLATLVIILLAIPLTVIMVQRQQNLQQEAATSKSCSRCSDTYKYTKAIWREGDSVCDRSKVIGTTTYSKDCSCTQGSRSKGYSCPTSTPVKKTCADNGGRCLDFNIYYCSTSITGLCPGGSNIRCCVGNYYRK